MWRKLVESTEGAAAKDPPSVAIINAPQTSKLLKDQPEFSGVGFSCDPDLAVYWLNGSLLAAVSADLTVYCINWLVRNWNLEEFIALKGPKVLHAYNYDPQSYDPDAEFAQQYLRLVCIEANAALALNVSDWKQFLLAELGSAEKQPPDVVTSIIIPSGWDSPAKILATREDFPVDKDWRQIELPQPPRIDIPQIDDTVEPIEITQVLAAIKGEKHETQDLNKVFSYLMDKASS